MKLSKGFKKRKYNIQTTASILDYREVSRKVYYYFRNVSENLVEFSIK